MSDLSAGDRQNDAVPAVPIGRAEPGVFGSPTPPGVIDSLVASGALDAAPEVSFEYHLAGGPKVVVIADGEDLFVLGDEHLAADLLAAANDGYTAASGTTRLLDLAQMHQVRAFLERNHGELALVRHDIRP